MSTRERRRRREERSSILSYSDRRVFVRVSRDLSPLLLQSFLILRVTSSKGTARARARCYRQRLSRTDAPSGEHSSGDSPARVRRRGREGGGERKRDFLSSGGGYRATLSTFDEIITRFAERRRLPRKKRPISNLGRVGRAAASICRVFFFSSLSFTHRYTQTFSHSLTRLLGSARESRPCITPRSLRFFASARTTLPSCCSGSIIPSVRDNVRDSE